MGEIDKVSPATAIPPRPRRERQKPAPDDESWPADDEPEQDDDQHEDGIDVYV
ncbi:MAG: hypothetical protein IBX49_01285 [Gammaproteobacteria bacterium]|nr:hypothetical protein [Gammaproteobacteria bacterium]